MSSTASLLFRSLLPLMTLSRESILSWNEFNSSMIVSSSEEETLTIKLATKLAILHHECINFNICENKRNVPESFRSNWILFFSFGRSFLSCFERASLIRLGAKHTARLVASFGASIAIDASWLNVRFNFCLRTLLITMSPVLIVFCKLFPFVEMISFEFPLAASLKRRLKLDETYFIHHSGGRVSFTLWIW